MIQPVKMEEIVHHNNLSAKILPQTLSGDNFRVPPHWHKDIELNLILSGTSLSIVDGRPSILTSGDMCVINSRKIHSGDTPDESVPIRLITIQWDYVFFTRYCPDFPKYQFSLTGRADILPEIRSRVLQIADLYAAKKPYYEMKISALLLETGYLLLEHCLEENPYYYDYESTRKAIQIQNAITYMEENYSQQISLTQIADQANMSPAYFSRKFKQLTGINFSECLALYRVQKARDELMNTENTMTEIAFNNGFANVKSFIQYFRKQYHTTPKQYQKAHKT